MLVQPDLFGEFDAAEAQAKAAKARAERWKQPATCPCCGTTEPNGWRLRNNHGCEPDEDGCCGFPMGEHSSFGGMCLAQYLVRNHVIYAWNNQDVDALNRALQRARDLNLDVTEHIQFQDDPA